MGCTRLLRPDKTVAPFSQKMSGFPFTNTFRTSMTNPDGQLALNTLSLSALQALLAQTNAAIEDRRVEELKVLADGYAKKLQMNGFSIREGMDALKPYLPTRRDRAQTM
jgi:hypothetical protein